MVVFIFVMNRFRSQFPASPPEARCVRILYCGAFEIGLELLNYFMGFTVCFCCHSGVSFGGHIEDFNGVTKCNKKEWGKFVIFFSLTSLYFSGGYSNLAAVGFSFPKIDARSSGLFDIDY